MSTFKKIDVVISILLITGFFIASLADLYLLFIGYFVVGGWHIISMIVHAIAGWFMQKGGARRFYIYTVAGFMSCALLGLVFEPFLFIFVILFFGAPVLAITYTHICYTELKALQTREQLTLK